MADGRRQLAGAGQRRRLHFAPAIFELCGPPPGNPAGVGDEQQPVGTGLFVVPRRVCGLVPPARPPDRSVSGRHRAVVRRRRGGAGQHRVSAACHGRGDGLRAAVRCRGRPCGGIRARHSARRTAFRKPRTGNRGRRVRRRFLCGNHGVLHRHRRTGGTHPDLARRLPLHRFARGGRDLPLADDAARSLAGAANG